MPPLKQRRQRPAVASSPPSLDLLLPSAAREQPACGSEPPPAHRVVHAREIFATIDGTSAPVFGRAAQAALEARMREDGLGGRSPPPRVLFLTHSHRQVEEYAVGAAMFALSAAHPLVADSSFAAISNNPRLSTFVLLEQLRHYPQRSKYLIHTSSNAAYWCGEFFSLHHAMRLWSRFTWVVYMSGPDVYLTPDAVLRLGHRMWQHGGFDFRAPPMLGGASDAQQRGALSDSVSASVRVSAQVAELAWRWVRAGSSSSDSRAARGSNGNHNDDGGRGPTTLHLPAAFIADPFPAPKHHTRWSMDCFAFRPAAFTRVPANTKLPLVAAPAALNASQSVFGDASAHCSCEGRYRLTESVLGEVITQWNLTTAVIGGRAPWGKQSHHHMGRGGIWHAHNASVVAAFVHRCRAAKGLAAGLLGCSGAHPQEAEMATLAGGGGSGDRAFATSPVAASAKADAHAAAEAGTDGPREVLDLFSFGGAHYERTLLLRLHELRHVVSRHVLIELGAPLSLNDRFVETHRPRLRWDPHAPVFRPFAKRVVHVQLDGERLLRGTASPSSAQAAMRTVGFAVALERVLPASSGALAWILLSDVDEIPRAASLARLLASADSAARLASGDVFAMEGLSCYYDVQCCAPPGSREAHWIAGPKLLSSGRLRATSWEALRTFRIRQHPNYVERIVPQSSWHLGYLMTPREIVTKLCLNTDPAVRRLCAEPDIEQRAARASSACNDLFGRKRVPLTRVTPRAVLDSMPAFAREHWHLFNNITSEELEH